MPHAVSYQWVKASGGYVPPDAVQVGFDGGNVVYVARAEHEGTYIPGKMLPVYRMCYIPCDGKEIEYGEYEILTDPSGTNLDWREALEADIPPGAVQGGTDVNGDPLYIGRVRHAGAMCSGKVQPTDGVLYVPYGGAEHIYESFEFLVMKDANS